MVAALFALDIAYLFVQIFQFNLKWFWYQRYWKKSSFEKST